MKYEEYRTSKCPAGFALKCQTQAYTACLKCLQRIKGSNMLGFFAFVFGCFFCFVLFCFFGGGGGGTQSS